MIQMSAASKYNFFDRMHIVRMLDQKELQHMNRIGARLKLTAQRSMRPQKANKKGEMKPSAPGKPPKRRGSMGEGLSKIYYKYDRARHSVVAGPLKFNWDAFPEATVPEAHEFGKTVSIIEAEFPVFGSRPGATRWFQVSKRGARRALVNGNNIRRKPIRFPARPFMRPALEKNMKFIRDTWADASGRVGV